MRGLIRFAETETKQENQRAHHVLFDSLRSSVSVGVAVLMGVLFHDIFGAFLCTLLAQERHLLKHVECLYFGLKIQPVILNNVRNTKAVDSTPYYSYPVSASA